MLPNFVANQTDEYCQHALTQMWMWITSYFEQVSMLKGLFYLLLIDTGTWANTDDC